MLKESEKDFVNSLVLFSAGAVGAITGAVCDLLASTFLAEADDDCDAEDAESSDDSQTASPSSDDTDAEDNKHS